MTEAVAETHRVERGGVRDRLIVALDTPDLATALGHVDRLGDAILWYKVGLQLFCAAGRDAVLALAERRKRIFLDLKLHDIPATVERAVGALRGLPVSFLTIHASGGPDMLRAAADAARGLGGSLRLLGVTMLTSLDGTEIPELWTRETDLTAKVIALARLSAESGLNGVIASPLELTALRERHAAPFLIVTPGIRSSDAPGDDQKRTLSLPEAFARGADYVVVGRPILQAPDPRAVLASYEAAVSRLPSQERTNG
jgi:orotidine-5'-phosphate decarboxylase